VDGRMSRDQLRELILGVLVRREAYGLEIATTLAARSPASALDSELPEGSVYPALRWLERQGFATARWVEIGLGAPRRRYYSLTPNGKVVAVRRARRLEPRPLPTPSAARL
jgi:DNA-binding PadR family transcriptional regulator